MRATLIRVGFGFCWIVAVLLSACNQYSERYQFVHGGPTMGTSFSIKVPHLPKTVDADQLKADIDRHLNEINGTMSTYLEDSELSQFNGKLSTDWQPVSAALFAVLKQAQQISVLSGGAYDVTIGPLVNLWGFGPDPMVFEAPADDLVNRKLNEIGYTHLKLRDDPLAVKKDIPELYLDLSSLAKGYAVDRIGELLEANKITDYLVEIGGEIKLKGNNINGKPWRIAIEKPAADKRMIQRILPITDIAVATSGDYRNFFEHNGVRFSHTIDPRTGRPITHKLASVTILRHTTMEADALATALMVLGPERGFQLAEQQQMAALFIVKSDGGFVEKSTSAYTELTR